MHWFKSSYSYANGCVEVCIDGERTVQVRHSRDPDGTVLAFHPAQWQHDVLDATRQGRFWWDTFAPLKFNLDEREAFVAGVRNDEFNLPT